MDPDPQELFRLLSTAWNMKLIIPAVRTQIARSGVEFVMRPMFHMIHEYTHTIYKYTYALHLFLSRIRTPMTHRLTHPARP